MSYFSKQKVFCQACGKEFETDFLTFKGMVCGLSCFKELEWRKVLSILRKEYYPDPQAGTYKEDSKR